MHGMAPRLLGLFSFMNPVLRGWNLQQKTAKMKGLNLVKS
jgi:hypothetical protein